MVRSKSAKRFERLAHTVMILVTICIVLPFILLFMSSITSESALVRDGYSFFPKEFSIHAYKLSGIMLQMYSGHMELQYWSL